MVWLVCLSFSSCHSCISISKMLKMMTWLLNRFALSQLKIMLTVYIFFDLWLLIFSFFFFFIEMLFIIQIYYCVLDNCFCYFDDWVSMSTFIVDWFICSTLLPYHSQSCSYYLFVLFYLPVHSSHWRHHLHKISLVSITRLIS